MATTYKVKTGDNLTKIAQQYGTTVSALTQANPQIKNPNYIYTGNVINIPGTGATKTATASTASAASGTAATAKKTTTGTATAAKAPAAATSAPAAVTAGTASGDTTTVTNPYINIGGISGNTNAALSRYGSAYTPSAGLTTAESAKNAAAAAVSGFAPYVSPYQLGSDALMTKILTQPDFKYDLNTDALYQQYKDQFQALGRTAMADAAGQAAALTGGYGNSYGTTASSQAYQSYLTQLNDKVPQLYQLAMDAYDRKQNNMYRQFEMMNAADQQAYQRYNDRYNRAVNDRDYYANEYNNAYARDYGEFSDNRSYWTNVADTENADYWQNKSYDYQQARDKVADSQWQKQFDESVRQFNAELDLKKKSSVGSSGGSGGSSSKKSSVSGTKKTESKEAKKVKKYNDGNTEQDVADKVSQMVAKYGETKLDFQTTDDHLKAAGITSSDAKEAAKTILRNSYGWTYSHRPAPQK